MTESYHISSKPSNAKMLKANKENLENSDTHLTSCKNKLQDKKTAASDKIYIEKWDKPIFFNNKPLKFLTTTVDPNDEQFMKDIRSNHYWHGQRSKEL